MMILDKMHRAPSDPRREVRRQWDAIIARTKQAGFSNEREDTMPTWKPNEVVLLIQDPPSPARRRADEYYRQRAVDQQRECLRDAARAHRSTPLGILHRQVYLDLPELPYAERFVPR